MAARRFDSEIIIDKQDRWTFRGNQITQPEILKYFRSSLKVSEDGIFIENVFGELSENGYVRAIGYPCHIINIGMDEEGLVFYADDDKYYKFPEFELYQTKDDCIIGIDSEKPLIKYRFDWNAASQLAEYLEEENGITYLLLGDVKMELPTYEGEIEVPLPASY